MNPLVSMLKPFLPQVKEKAVPAVEDAICTALDSIPTESETQKAILIMTKSNGKPYILKVTLDRDDKVVKVVDTYPVKDLVDGMMENLTKMT